MKRNRVELYFPTKRGNGNTMPIELYRLWLASAKVLFCDLFGGYTAFEGSGGFRSPKHGHIIEEKVHVIYAYCSDAEMGVEDAKDLRAFAKKLKDNLVQECVAIVINNTMEFIS